MPRVSALRSAALRDLANQYRFAARRNALHALDALDSLALRLDDDATYSSRWLVHELTGYTPDTTDDEALFPGSALRAELSAFAEHICVAIALRPDELEGALTVEDLEQRWSVTRRTIERYRRQGLVARRVGEGAQARLLFTPAAVDSFERSRDGSAREKPAASRTTSDERDDFVRRARRYRARLGWSLAQTSRRIALRAGRSPDTVRRAILAHDRDAREPVFPRRSSVDDRERELVLRALRRGVSASDLAAIMGRSRESVARIANERLLTRLREFDLRAPASPLFERDDAHEVLLAPRVVRAALLPERAESALDFLAQARAQKTIDAREETALAVALCFLRWRAAGALASLPDQSPSAQTLDEIETDLRWASRLVVKLARTQRRVALLAIEERVGDPLELRDEHVRALHLASMHALADAALRFDPFRKGRLAARSAVALTHALSSSIASLGLRARDGAPSGEGRAKRRADRQIPLDDWTLDAAPWSRFVEPDHRVRDNLETLDEPARSLLTLRYGFTGEPPVSRAVAARTLDLHPPAAGALERASLRRALGLPPTPELRSRYPATR
jgi:hypothetical protein